MNDRGTLQEQLQGTLGALYTVERELGGGGMSRVFVARDNALDRLVVIKVLHPELSASVSVDRFRREILLAAALQHPHIVGILSAGETDGVPYFIMPYVEGESLRGRLARGRMGIVEVVGVLRDVARALAYAHERGVVHRDVKPDNVMLSAGSACVLDFGVAKALASARDKSREHTGTLTLFGTSLGTPGYMSPEQAAADPATDQRADIYSLGITAYEMLTGAPPFRRATPQATLAAQLTETPAPIQSHRADVPSALVSLVHRCLAKEPDDRPQTAGAILSALEDPAVISGAFATPGPITIPMRRRWWTEPATIGVAVIGLMTIAIGAIVLARGPSTSAPPAPAAPAALPVAAAPAAPSIAVLPLVNLGRDSADQYFADGMSEEITSKLAKVRGLRVASRTAAISVRGKAASVAEIGKLLNVATLLEGTMQRDKNRLRITARLVSVADGFTLWSDVYERDPKDIFSVQDEISQAIVVALGAELHTEAPVTPNTVKRAVAPAAYNEYLLGRFFFAKRGDAALRSAIEHFKAAVKIDSSYALAYAGIADAYSVLPLYGPTKGDEVWPLAMSAADRAITLDSTLAEGYAARGNLLDAAWRWSDAERDLRRAIELRPSYAQAHQWLGENLMVNGRLGESVTELKRATDLDPTSPIALGIYALALGVAGDSTSAFEQGKKAVDLDPSLYATRFMLGTVKLYSAKYGEAIRDLEGAAALSKGLDAVRGMLGYAYAKAGDRARATAIVAELEKAKTPDAFAIARVYVGLGDNAKALHWFERAASQHNGYFQSESLQSPIFEPLRGDPQFGKIVHSVGLKV